ncbi:metallophosphoesterase [Rubrivirga litoralis]|uniref:Metallophosphoesterase n=1 Tax=Rubrivirga litoralis TaxID=3075598 RepID=A0ABU3BPP0_9BACT|nr:metallophosphoesterase [Rubrivirga sp. F394]MDT0631238.1 metallophosphoesterase [Rubrivirga sp. F394]
MFGRVLAGLGLFLLFFAVYGVFIEPRILLDDKKFVAEVPDLPPAWDGKKVALVADFQYGMWLDNVGMMEETVEDVVDEGVALLLVAGDFLYKPDSTKAEEVVEILRPALAAGIPVVAVLGNHDYSLMKKDSDERPPIAEYLAERLRAAGATVLENDAVAVPAPGGGDPLWVAGIGSVWAENSRPDRALAAVPDGAARLVLMHNPESYRQIPADAAPLAFAAHTHGGQVRVFPGEHSSWLDIVREGETIADGWAADSIGAPGNRLYVNRGVGFSTVPVRINCRPELTVATLRPARGALPESPPRRTTDG